MGRWKPDAGSRLQQAALELYSERGFAEVTVAEIAQRAGLTERTFFRHFSDKREVLFVGGIALEELMMRALASAPDHLPPIDAIARAVAAAGPAFADRRAYARKRQAVISANAELQERERIKLASLATALATGLRRRGVAERTANLAAEMGITVFRLAFERWIDEPNERDLTSIIKDSMNELRSISAGE